MSTHFAIFTPGRYGQCCSDRLNAPLENHRRNLAMLEMPKSRFFNWYAAFQCPVISNSLFRNIAHSLFYLTILQLVVGIVVVVNLTISQAIWIDIYFSVL